MAYSILEHKCGSIVSMIIASIYKSSQGEKTGNKR